MYRIYGSHYFATRCENEWMVVGSFQMSYHFISFRYVKHDFCQTMAIKITSKERCINACLVCSHALMPLLPTEYDNHVKQWFVDDFCSSNRYFCNSTHMQDIRVTSHGYHAAVLNNLSLSCFFNHLFSRRLKKTSKLPSLAFVRRIQMFPFVDSIRIRSI